MANTNLTVVSAEEPPERPSSTQVCRPARALIGWMRPEAAQATLLASSTDPDAAASGAALAAAARARRAVAARPEGIDQDGLVRPAPPELAGHIRELQASQAAQPYFAEGWRVALVDLTRVVACQPAAVSDQATNRVAAIDPDDLAAVAALTLPTTQGEPVTARFDRCSGRGQWCRRMATCGSSARPGRSCSRAAMRRCRRLALCWDSAS